MQGGGIGAEVVAFVVVLYCALRIASELDLTFNLSGFHLDIRNNFLHLPQPVRGQDV